MSPNELETLPDLVYDAMIRRMARELEAANRAANSRR
jgi:hypothetical protein